MPASESALRIPKVAVEDAVRHSGSAGSPLRCQFPRGKPPPAIPEAMSDLQQSSLRSVKLPACDRTVGPFPSTDEEPVAIPKKSLSAPSVAVPCVSAHGGPTTRLLGKREVENASTRRRREPDFDRCARVQFAGAAEISQIGHHDIAGLDQCDVALIDPVRLVHGRLIRLYLGVKWKEAPKPELVPLDLQARRSIALKRRVDLGEQAANAVAGLSDLSGEIIVEAAQHGELGELLVPIEANAACAAFDGQPRQ